VIYPADTGQVADRLYVGDADGQLWRVDLSNTDPNQWTFTLAWDAYVDTNSAVRERVAIAPVLSRDPVGNMTILFATGNQDVLTSTSTDNRVWSLTETPLQHNTSQNWVLKFAPGQYRVTGPMALFNNILYFSTYTPGSNATSVCANGFPTLWAVDYVRPDPANTYAIGAPVGQFGTPPPVQLPLKQDGTADGTVIYGVSATETPACGGSVNTNDAYFGSHSAVSSVSQSEYRIMWQTGAGSGLTTNGTGVRNEASIKGMQNMTISSPGLGTRIDSWAAIVE
jgi:type IV pilus assembly protein PilY1